MNLSFFEVFRLFVILLYYLVNQRKFQGIGYIATA